MTTNSELMRVVAALAEANYPGLPVDFVALHLRGLAAPIQLPMPPFAEPRPSPVEDGERGPGLSRAATLDILATLREVGRPLSTTRLLKEMGKAGREYSQSTVCRRLAELMEDHTIENPADARPRGYRLAPET